MKTSHPAITNRSAATRLLTLFALACIFAFADRASAQVREMAYDEVRGIIAIHGADLPANAIRVRARPLISHCGDGKPTRPIVAMAVRVEAANPGRLFFSIRGLIPGVPYRIGVKLTDWSARRAPRLVWSSDRDPLVLAGETDLQFDAHAVQANVEVLGLAGDRNRALWVSADSLDFTDPERGVRAFRWRTTLANVSGGQLQISFTPFPRPGRGNYSPCDGGEGMLYTQDFPLVVGRDGWAMTPPVDFNALLNRGRGALNGDPRLPGIVGPAALDPDFDSLIMPKLLAGHPLYVRVLPMIAGEVVCDPDTGGVPPEVLLALLAKLKDLSGPEPQVAIGTVTYSQPEFGKLPKGGQVCYRVTKSHHIPNTFFGATAWEHLVATAPEGGVGYNTTAPEGHSFCVNSKKSDDGWLESFAEGFTSALTGLIDSVGKLVNYTSKLWEEIQDAVVEAAGDALVTLGIPCDAQCRSLLETGLEIGLASMGVPPSLPNFDELTDQGLEYLADQAAAQFIGVPVPAFVTDYAAAQAKEFIKEVARNMKDDYGVPGLPDWLAPDIRFQPAHLLIELYGPGKNQPFNSRPTIFRLNTLIYAGTAVQIPRHLPKQGVEPPLLFPMVLPPNTAKLPELQPVYFKLPSGKIWPILPSEYTKAVFAKNKWLALRYDPPSACYSLRMSAASDPGGFYSIFSATFNPKDPSKPCKP